MMHRHRIVLAVLALSAAASRVPAQAAAPVPIRDNSFLIEEAYNQEWGVVQHVGTWQRMRGSVDWGATFTQEWPVPGERHQVSYTIPVERVSGNVDINELSLTYRYQIPMRAGSPLAIAPRLSVVRQLRESSVGGGSQVGAEVNLPVSVELSRLVVTHFNAGAYWSGTGSTLASPSESFVGQSLILLLHPKLNLMLEALFAAEGGAKAVAGDAFERSFFIAPGFRGAIDFASGLQIVPGIAFPIGVGPSDGEKGIYLYLSFEHLFRRR